MMQESNQEVPHWLNQHAESSISFSQSQHCDGYDYRNAPSVSENYYYSSSYGGAYSNLNTTIASSYDVPSYQW